MHIQVNSDDNIAGREQLAQEVESAVTDILGRFSDRITRVEVHLSDKNAGKSGSNDKRCLMEARPAGRPPIAVTQDADSLADAYSGAARKLRRLLESTLGRENDHKGADSIRKDGAVV